MDTEHVVAEYHVDTLLGLGGREEYSANKHSTYCMMITVMLFLITTNI